MDNRRSWPWKKKSDRSGTERTVAILEEAAAGAGTLLSTVSQKEKDSYKNATYIQISVESYSRLTGLEEQVKSLGETIAELNEELSASQSEITTKETLVKQHSKVAEDAVSGWEKAESEVLALKNHLESTTLLKLAAEDRGSRLDHALKECMKQMHNLREEQEEELIDIVHCHTKQLKELESKISNLDQKLQKSEAENAILSRSLQERSNLLIKLSEEKSQADSEIEKLKSNLESCQKEMNSLKYEHHVVTKELEIRNEEKNMSVRSAEVANRNHLEGVKKISKLEAECQRLRGLVRKKLPGPAALAQMKLEVENLGRDNKESSFRKENEFLNERMFTIEEETKTLKEALATRNNELHVSRKKLQLLESRIQEMSENSKNTELMDDFLEMEKLAAISKVTTLHFNDVESNDSSDCIDKIALPENKLVQESPIERDPNDYPDLNILNGSKGLPWKCSFEEFQLLKLEKEKLFMDLETNKNQLNEAETIRAEIISQLESSQKMNGLSDIQLKCMAESYNALEKREEELNMEVNVLQRKIESINNELLEEKRHHQEDLAKCNELQEQLQRMERSVAESESKNQQEKDLAAASKKLAECQETMYTLGKQLKAMRPQLDYVEQEQESNSQDIDYNQAYHSDAEINAPSKSLINTTHSKHRPTKSSSSYSTFNATPVKHSHGFSRFFSSKCKYAD